MSLWQRLSSLDGKVLSLGMRRYRPAEGETRQAFLARISGGLPMLGYAEVLRAPVLELAREVVTLRVEVDDLRSRLAALEQAG